ncbi:helix-hairpin-helix domain-containing protein [Aestuariicella hydrocarbonica]|uniref:Helix-hairpin-helix domain-containing protein n=2 Tax=Pseudomaricurvus hydrocarbonicus TaxID=1470433 RepID=A0A9E5JTZ1_9GAMM|nr:helix-hairpin-helix domain-containing protein [Aestuariicella hydrocarbonica]
MLCMFSLSSPVSWAETANAAPSATQAIYAVNINTASAEEIAATLKGIGLKKAQAIVAFRESNGQFASKEALMAVKGIGESTVAKNSELISLK